MEHDEMKKALELCFEAFDIANKEEEEALKRQTELQLEYDRRVHELELLKVEIDSSKKEVEKKGKNKIDMADIALYTNLRLKILDLYNNRGVPNGKINKIVNLNKAIEDETAKFEDYVALAEYGNKMILSLERENDIREKNSISSNDINYVNNDMKNSKISSFVEHFFPKEEQK